MSYVCVLPYIWEPYKDEWRKTAHPSLIANTMFIANTKHNLGIMRSHNLGIDRMRETGADWLIISSAAVRFGEPGGMDFIQALDDHDGHVAVEADGVYGWHLIAFSRRCLTLVGRWDENFSPYGPDDIDMSLRIQRAFGLTGQLWTKVPVDVTDAGMAHSINVAGLKVDNGEWQRDYFARKWGRHPDASTVPAYDRPFNVPANPISYWPEAVNGGRWDD